MAFAVKVTINDSTMWCYQWATLPTNEQIEEHTFDTKPGDPLYTGRYASRICSAIIQIRDDDAILDIEYNDGMKISRAK